MNSILVTGGKGHLGRKVVSSLLSIGSKVDVLTTKVSTPDTENNIVYHTGDPAENTGLKEATADVNTIIHCASNSGNFQHTDIQGTKNLLKAINKRSLKHLVYISIVGVDKSDYPYYQAKLEVEKIVSNSGLPFSIVRTTQFHSFVLHMIEKLINESANDKSILKIPGGMKFQSIATEEVAGLLAEISLESPKGLLPDVGGPEILSFEEMSFSYVKQFQPDRVLQVEMTDDQRHHLFRSGVNLCPNNIFGKETWESFLKTIN